MKGDPLYIKKKKPFVKKLQRRRKEYFT